MNEFMFCLQKKKPESLHILFIAPYDQSFSQEQIKSECIVVDPEI